MVAPIMDVSETLSGEEELPSVTGPCKLCLQKSAKYTCPRCNVRYCDLACYQSEKHAACSESFYKDWVHQELPHVTASDGDRQRMMEILTRCQQSAQEDLDSDDDLDEEETLEERMAGLDLDRDVDEVWNRLTDAERSEFNALLASGQLSALVDVWTPWWTQKVPKVQDSDSVGELVEGQPPCLTDIPDITSLTRSKPSSDLRFSVVSVLLSYAFLARLHNGLHLDTPADCAQELLEACPTLSPGPAPSTLTQALQGVSHALHSSKHQCAVSPGQFAELLEDVCQMVSGGSVSVCLPFLLSALSDLTSLLRLALQTSKPKQSTKGKKEQNKTVPQKATSATPPPASAVAPQEERSGTTGDCGTERSNEEDSKMVVDDTTHRSASLEQKKQKGTCRESNADEKSLERGDGKVDVPQDREDSRTTSDSRREGEVVNTTTHLDSHSGAEVHDLGRTEAAPHVTQAPESTALPQRADDDGSPSSARLPRTDPDSVPPEERPKTSASEKPHKKVRFADKAKPAHRSGETRDSEHQNFRQRLRQAEKKVEFLVSWIQRYGMALGALLPELQLETASRKAEAEDMDTTRSKFEKLWGGKTPKSKQALIQEL